MGVSAEELQVVSDCRVWLLRVQSCLTAAQGGQRRGQAGAGRAAGLENQLRQAVCASSIRVAGCFGKSELSSCGSGEI